MRCTTAQVDQRREICATILVIEDEGFVRDVTCEILRDAGYRGTSDRGTICCRIPRSAQQRGIPYVAFHKRPNWLRPGPW